MYMLHDSWDYIRGRPLVIWARRKPRKKKFGCPSKGKKVIRASSRKKNWKGLLQGKKLKRPLRGFFFFVERPFWGKKSWDTIIAMALHSTKPIWNLIFFRNCYWYNYYLPWSSSDIILSYLHISLQSSTYLEI